MSTDTNHTHNTSNCLPDLSPLEQVKMYVNSLEFLAPTITLILFNVVVVAGNSLVIIAVFTSKKLRGVTNTYIVSLAFSDLFLGLLVLPFSSANEVRYSRSTLPVVFFFHNFFKNSFQYYCDNPMATIYLGLLYQSTLFWYFFFCFQQFDLYKFKRKPCEGFRNYVLLKIFHI